MSLWMRRAARLGLLWALLALLLPLAAGAAMLAWAESRTAYSGPMPLKPPPRGNAREQPAIDAVAALGGHVTVDGDAPDRPVVGVDICRPLTPVSDADLRNLPAFTGLRELHVCFLHPDGDAMHTLGGLTTLHTLDIGGVPVTDDGLECLAPLADLEQLDLSGSRVTDAGLKRLCAFPRLRALGLGDTQVGDGGMECIAGLENLQSLELGHTRVTDAGLEHLGKLAGLRELNLGGTRVTEAALGRLGAFPDLEHLGLAGLPITDADLPRLADFPRLRMVQAMNTRVTRKGIEDLHQARPSLVVLIGQTPPPR